MSPVDSESDLRPFELLRVRPVRMRYRDLVELATAAERLGYVGLVVADVGGAGPDPITVASALAPTTKTLGLVPEVHTGRQHPFGVSRRLTGLDQVSGGRAGWAPVDENRERMMEAIEIAGRLWASWPADVVVADKDFPMWVDTDRIQPVDFRGQHYSVQAPLDLPRGPQGLLPLLLSGQSVPAYDGLVVSMDTLIVRDLGEGPVPAPERRYEGPVGSLTSVLSLGNEVAA